MLARIDWVRGRHGSQSSPFYRARLILDESLFPSEIVEVFFDGSFIVKTGDSSLMVKEYEGACLTHKDIGRRFGHLNKPRKVWEDLPE